MAKARPTQPDTAEESHEKILDDTSRSPVDPDKTEPIPANGAKQPIRKPRAKRTIKPANELPEPFSAEELAESYASIPADDLEPVQFPTDATSGEWRASATSVPMQWKAALAPNSPAPTTDPISIQSANKTKNKPNTKDKTKTAKTNNTNGNDSKGQVDNTRGDSSHTPPADKPNQTTVMGDDLLSDDVEAEVGDQSSLTREESQAAATRRWRSTGIAEQVAVFRDRMREEYSAANPKSKRRDAHEHAWACAMAAFPPPGVEPILPMPAMVDEAEPVGELIETPPSPIPSDQGVPGLGTLPDSWGILPANASLQVEISWVSANRLRVRDGAGVNLSRALSPAPSYSALSWLETSILFPSKFADISVKATANQDDEKEAIRREKLSIEEIRGLLAEMLEG